MYFKKLNYGKLNDLIFIIFSVFFRLTFQPKSVAHGDKSYSLSMQGAILQSITAQYFELATY